MENFEHVAHLDSVILRIDKILSHTDDADLRQAILMWVKHVLASKKPFAAQAAHISSLSEVHDMLSERMDKWIALQEQAILAKGIEQGIEKGIGKGERLVLQRQMAKRFGALPEWALRRLEQATQAELEHWADQILEASTLEALFQ